MKNILKFNEFILEKKLYIYTRTFRLKDLIDNLTYPIETIEKWKQEYDCDDFARCVFVSHDKINNLNTLGLRISAKDIKNKTYFDDQAKYLKGILVEDSKMIKNEDEFYLYIFDKNSNSSKRSRQNHGFLYENSIKRLNGLENFNYTHKWDAKGALDKRFLDERQLIEGKEIILSDGSEYDWDTLDPRFKSNMFWNIKTMKYGSSIYLGDFLRIAGYEKQNGGLIKLDNNIKHFMFVVSFHNNNDTNKELVEEYLIYIDVDVWKTYLPNIDGMIQEFEEMYNDLGYHRLKGDRTEETESNWKLFRDKYEKLTEDYPIKLNFKRDSNGQIRIQSSIGYRAFKSLMLKNPHIKIK